MKKSGAERLIEFCMSVAVVGLLVFALVVALAGCGSPDRDLVYDSDECLAAGKRAVMLCPKYMDRCVIECREKLAE